MSSQYRWSNTVVANAVTICMLLTDQLIFLKYLNLNKEQNAVGKRRIVLRLFNGTYSF